MHLLGAHYSFILEIHPLLAGSVKQPRGGQSLDKSRGKVPRPVGKRAGGFNHSDIPSKRRNNF